MNKYQEFIHDLLDGYDLPEQLVEDLESMRVPNPQLYRNEDSISDHTESSTGHYLPIKEDNLNTTHEKHRELIPVLDFSKLGN